LKQVCLKLAPMEESFRISRETTRAAAHVQARKRISCQFLAESWRLTADSYFRRNKEGNP
jgi:hypothetical protein